MRLQLRKDAAGCTSEGILQVERGMRQLAIPKKLRSEQSMVTINNQAGTKAGYKIEQSGPGKEKEIRKAEGP